MMQRFRAAMAILAGLAILAGVTLDGPIRIGTLVFLGGIALKTWIAVLRDRVD
jgi:uncharacterized membrane protein YczE